MKKIKMLMGDQGGCGFYRMKQPAYYLQKRNPEELKIETSQEVNIIDMTGKKYAMRFRKILQFLMKKFPGLENKLKFKPIWDLLVFQRQYAKMVLTDFLYLKGRGAKVVYELDDFVFNVEKVNPAFKEFMPKERQWAMVNFITNAHALTVSTEKLRTLLLPLNKNIYVLPNCIDFAVWEPYYKARKALKKDPEKVCIGWAGSTTHLTDIMMVKDVLIGILKRFPQVYLKIVGFKFNEIIPGFKEFGDRIVTADWRKDMAFQDNLLEFDIAIAPLRDTTFNRAKSNIKFLEYSALAIPTVASRVEPYLSIKNDETGFLTTSKNDYLSWEKPLKKLIENPSLRERIGEAARAYTKANFDISKRIEEWERAYSEILEQPVDTKIEIMYEGVESAGKEEAKA